MNPVAKLADRVLEASVIGSFTKIGSAARSRLHDWTPVDDDLDGQTVLLTGGSSGIGKAAATALVRLGATVILTSRSAERAEQVSREIGDGARGRAIGWALDTADFSSINDLADRLELEFGTIDVLVHNAGALLPDHSTTPYGIETTLASHLVGPYHLTNRVLPRLNRGGRILWMSSGGMYTQALDVDKLQMTPSNYNGTVAYARAKRAQVELVNHMGRQLQQNLVVHAMHPGWVDTDGVSQGLPGFGKLMGPLLRTAESGADTMVWLAAGHGDSCPPGSFFLDRSPRSTSYLPGTAADDAERTKLVEWLDLTSLPGTLQ